MEGEILSKVVLVEGRRARPSPVPVDGRSSVALPREQRLPHIQLHSAHTWADWLVSGHVWSPRAANAPPMQCPKGKDTRHKPAQASIAHCRLVWSRTARLNNGIVSCTLIPDNDVTIRRLNLVCLPTLFLDHAINFNLPSPSPPDIHSNLHNGCSSYPLQPPQADCH